MNVKQIAIMVLAGVASALAVFAASRVGPGAVPLLLLGAFPVYVAALSFGTQAGIGASVVSILTAGLIGGFQAGLVIALAFNIPASIIGHQANLGQTREDGTMEWYPLDMLFQNLCILLSVGIILLGFFVGYDTELLTQQMRVAVEEVLRQNPPPTPMTDEDINLLTESVFRVLPFVFSGMWVIIHVVNLYFAAMVSRGSKMMPRPKDDIPATANLPKTAIFIVLVSLVCASFLSGPLQLVLGVVAGVFLMAFALLGLASMHFNARTSSTGMLSIFVSYALILFLYLPIYFFAITGVLRNINGNPQSTPKSNGA